MRLRNKVYIESKLKEANIHMSRALSCVQEAWTTLMSDKECVNMAVDMTLPFDGITKTIKKSRKNVSAVLVATSTPEIYEANK